MGKGQLSPLVRMSNFRIKLAVAAHLSRTGEAIHSRRTSNDFFFLSSVSASRRVRVCCSNLLERMFLDFPIKRTPWS